MTTHYTDSYEISLFVVPNETNITQLLICCWYKVSKHGKGQISKVFFFFFYRKRSSIVCQCFWFSNAPHCKYSVQILQLHLMVPYVFFPPAGVSVMQCCRKNAPPHHTHKQHTHTVLGMCQMHNTCSGNTY